MTKNTRKRDLGKKLRREGFSYSWRKLAVSAQDRALDHDKWFVACTGAVRYEKRRTGLK